MLSPSKSAARQTMLAPSYAMAFARTMHCAASDVRFTGVSPSPAPTSPMSQMAWPRPRSAAKIREVLERGLQARAMVFLPYPSRTFSRVMVGVATARPVHFPGRPFASQKLALDFRCALDAGVADIRGAGLLQACPSAEALVPPKLKQALAKIDRSVPGLLSLIGGFITLSTLEASAAVCARGVYRAGCVAPRGAVGYRSATVVRRGAAGYRSATVVRRGTAVRRRGY